MSDLASDFSSRAETSSTVDLCQRLPQYSYEWLSPQPPPPYSCEPQPVFPPPQYDQQSTDRGTLLERQGARHFRRPLLGVEQLEDAVVVRMSSLLPKQPNTFLIWSCISVLCFMPLGIAALIYSKGVKTDYAAGLYTLSQRKSSIALMLNIVATILWVVLTMLALVLVDFYGSH